MDIMALLLSDALSDTDDHCTSSMLSYLKDDTYNGYEDYGAFQL